VTVNQTIRPFLMFQAQDAEAAMTFYVSLFPDSEILDVQRYGAAGPGPEGTLILARFRIGGHEILCSDSFVKHAFEFTPSSSLFVDCVSEDEIARLAAALADDGAVLMPLNNYGFSRRFTWVNDRFGVSWQLNLA
jgi:predicted 3-demethylubiquinone-9 3-methyltransferase (glyoxalase superfamily)